MKFAERFKDVKPSGMLKIFQAAEADPEVISLGIGEPDFDTEPDIIDEAARAARAGFTHYGPVQGLPAVRQSVCDYWDRRYGLKSTPEEVQIMAGGIQSAYLALQALLNPGDEVITAEPCFGPYFDQIYQNQGKVVHLATTAEEGFMPSAESLERVITPKSRVLMICSPSNPTGRVMDRARMEGIAKVVEKHDLIALSDEIYDALVYKGNHIPFASIPGMKERTLTMGGLSKSHCMTGWRLGYAIGPAPLIRVMTLLGANQTYGINVSAQMAAKYALDNHDHKTAERAKIFFERLSYCSDRLNAMKGIKCAPPEGAFYLFPDVTGTGLSSEDFAWRLIREAKVAVLPGGAFGECGEGYVRLACTRSMDDLVKAMDRVEEFAKGL
ncbi:MAG: pyridoxal phosphate-dependent aminotransferase [Synergistaceae bacterium]|nr:pyridoxal phosphate-dependent aminotransferase [Synergistaceae bacterium]